MNADEVPAASVEVAPEDPRFVSLEIHTLPLDARGAQFLRVDGYWFVKASEGASEVMEEAWRSSLDETENAQGGRCQHVAGFRGVQPGQSAFCVNCGAELFWELPSMEWREKGETK